MKPHIRIAIATLLGMGTSQHEIARVTGVDRKSIRRQQANSPRVATGFGARIGVGVGLEGEPIGLREAPRVD